MMSIRSGLLVMVSFHCMWYIRTCSEQARRIEPKSQCSLSPIHTSPQSTSTQYPDLSRHGVDCVASSMERLVDHEVPPANSLLLLSVM